MKTKQIESSEIDLLKIGRENETILTHILSPLELCAWNNKYKSFTYHLDSIPIKVSDFDCMKLLNLSKTKFETLILVLYKKRNKIEGKNSKVIQLFLDSDIRTHQLPTYILNILCYRYNCNTVYHVLQLGKKKVSQSKGIGREGLKRLEQFFKNNGCELLF